MSTHKPYPPRAAESVKSRHTAVERLTRSGLTIDQIVESVGLSRTSVVRIRSARGLARSKRAPLTDPQKASATQMLNDGAPVSEVARTLGVGRWQIDYHFPGKAWTRRQSLDHLHTLMRLDPDNRSRHQIDVFWALKKASS